MFYYTYLLQPQNRYGKHLHFQHVTFPIEKKMTRLNLITQPHNDCVKSFKKYYLNNNNT